MNEPNLNTIAPSIIRTAIPAAWGALIALGIKQFPSIENVVEDIALLGQVLTWVVIALWYAFSRWLEPKVPVFLRVILFGTSQQPAAYSRQSGEIEAVTITSDDGTTGTARKHAA